MKTLPPSLHLAVGSTVSRPGDIAGNLNQIAQFAEIAGRDGVDLLLTPEMSVSGYGNYPDVLATAERAGEGEIYRGLARIAREFQVVLAAGFVEASGEKRHLAHYVVYPDGTFVVQRKHRVTPTERPLDPARPLIPESPQDDCGQPADLDLQVFEVRGVRCGILICADHGITDIYRRFAAENIGLMLCPCGAGGVREERMALSELGTAEGRARYLELLKGLFFPGNAFILANCIEHGIAFAEVNQGGYDGRHHYHAGHGMIINPFGEVLGFLHGIPVLERQRPLYAHAQVDFADQV